MSNNVKNINDKRHSKKKKDENEKHKNTFDKKKYRLQKYSNQYKVDQWQKNKKKSALHEFHRQLKKDPQNSTHTSLDLNNKLKDIDETSKSKKKGYAFYKAKREYQRKKEEKKKVIEDNIRVKTEREEALKQYKEKKLRTFKALSRRTKKGQPVMKDRIEILLEKIQKDLT